METRRLTIGEADGRGDMKAKEMVLAGSGTLYGGYIQWLEPSQ